ncbi:MAG: hypothetical protein AAF721_41940, partial [Myxococcota bacterium]
RNQTFLADPETMKPLRRGELDVKAPSKTDREAFPLLPTSIRLRYGKLASLDSVTATDSHAVVKLKASKPDKAAELLDFTKGKATLAGSMWECPDPYLAEVKRSIRDPGWPSENYDRLVVPNGQNARGIGQPEFFGQIGTLSAIDLGGRMVGLASSNGRVRVLGAAAQVYNGYGVGDADLAGASPRDRMWAYRATLPVSAVPDGFILSGINIAVANGFFDADANRNKNVNTMTRTELSAALSGRDAIVTAIVEQRNAANGYADYDALAAAIGPHLSTPLTGGDRAAIKELEFGYPAAD